MKKTRMLVALVLACMFAFTIVLAACNSHECQDKCEICGKCTSACTNAVCLDKCAGHKQNDDEGNNLGYAPNTELRMATGYNSADTGLFFSAAKAGDGITLPDGKTYYEGDLKPTWQELSNVLQIKFVNKYQGNSSAEKEWNAWENNLGEVDMVAGSAAKINAGGAAGKVIDLNKHMDKLPNFKAYLDANPIVRLSITGSVVGADKGAIYYSPYFDGANDIERMPLMRTDWLVELLDGEGAYTNSGTVRNLAAAQYQPYMPVSGKVKVDAMNAEGTAVVEITKDYDAHGNIIKIMNDALAQGDVTGVQAVNMLRDYIDAMYPGVYGTKRSNLYIGYNACYDADELVALLRCVVANISYTPKGGEPTAVAGLFSRETGNNQRQVDLFRFAGILFGVRGLESRQDYLYIGTDGKLHDARQEEDAYIAMERMNQMCQEGLIIMTGESTSTNYLENDSGFMSYDYSQTQTLMNRTKLQEGEKYMAAMIPVACWNDGAVKYMRFTESWRSVKTDAWAISAAGVANNPDKLNAALALIDYAYSEQGQILMSYGPDAFIDVKDATKTAIEEKYNTFNFNGKQMPKISAATEAHLWSSPAGGNYTNYARWYLGSTLSFVKSQAFEYQCTHEVGREGAAKLSAGIGLGTIKHPELAITENKWYTSVPTTLPLTDNQNTQINATNMPELSSSGKFSQAKGGNNLFLEIIKGGYNLSNFAADITSRATALTTVKTTWKAAEYLTVKQSGWDNLQVYYNSLQK